MGRAFNYQVAIKDSAGELPAVLTRYRIGSFVEVVADNTNPVATDTSTPIGDAITGDLSTANSLTSTVGDSTLTGLMSSVSTAIAAVPSFTNAAQSTLNAVLLPINAASARTAVLISSTDATIAAGRWIRAGLRPERPVSSLPPR